MRTPIKLAMVIGGGASPIVRLVRDFTPSGNSSAVLRCKITGTTQWWSMYQHLGGSRYFGVTLKGDAMAPGAAPMRQTYAYIHTHNRLYNNTTTPATTKDGTWAAGASLLGGGYYALTAAGKYVQLVTEETDIQSISVASYAGLAAAGMFLVTIDGDATLANLLPTAQELVTAGSLAAEALVAGGGTLNPTDRIFDNYNNTNNVGEAGHNLIGGGAVTPVANSLAAGAHTVKFTQTAYRNVSSSGDLFSGINGFLVDGDLAFSATHTSFPMFLVYKTLTATPCVWDVSYNFKPTGASNYEWLGHTGSRVMTEVPSATVDGVAATMEHAAYFAGTEIIIYTPTKIRHAETGATDQGDWNCYWKMHKTNGFTIAHTTDWSTAGVAVGYPCMLDGLSTVYDRYATLGGGSVTDASMGANNGAQYCNFAARAAYCWKSDDYYGMLFYVPDLALTVEDYAKAGDLKFFWMDIAGGTSEKAYVRRFGSDEAYTEATTWYSEANYRLGWFTAGANSVLSGY